MNLQLALDRLSKEECFQLLEQTNESIDWIEVGTGVIKEYGMSIVREIKHHYPEKTLVADMKTCDAGKHEAKQAFEAGADITTVMAFSSNQTIQDTLEVANQYGKRIMVDLLGITSHERIEELNRLHVDLVSLHFGKDMQQSGSLEEGDTLDLVKHQDFEVAVAGGINPTSLPNLVEHEFSTFIVGSAITKQPHPGEVARDMKGVIDDYEEHNTRRSN